VSGEATIPAGGERTRRGLLRDGIAGALVAGGVLGAGAVASAGASASLPQQDAKILNFLLELERLQTSFFERAGGDKRFSAELRQFASVTARQDRAHVAALRSLLGSAAGATTAQLKADPHDDASFVHDALTLKEAAVAAYIGEAPNLSVARITPVAGIVSVEARHAAWIRSIAAVIPAPRAADRSQKPGTVARSLEGSGLATVR
jgi:Ferritin-like domain